MILNFLTLCLIQTIPADTNWTKLQLRGGASFLSTSSDSEQDYRQRLLGGIGLNTSFTPKFGFQFGLDLQGRHFVDQSNRMRSTNYYDIFLGPYFQWPVMGGNLRLSPSLFGGVPNGNYQDRNFSQTVRFFWGLQTELGYYVEIGKRIEVNLSLFSKVDATSGIREYSGSSADRYLDHGLLAGISLPIFPWVSSNQTNSIHQDSDEDFKKLKKDK